jgi:hypothetical protein
MPQPFSVPFHNARMFDGVKETASGQGDVLVQENKNAQSPVSSHLITEGDNLLSILH